MGLARCNHSSFTTISAEVDAKKGRDRVIAAL
jgi:hypothetical protein